MNQETISWDDFEKVEMRVGTILEVNDFNADTSGMLPIPAIFVIDRNALIRYIYLDPDYRNRIEIATLTAQL